MTDRELLMVLYGAIKAMKQFQGSDLLRMIENHLFPTKEKK